MIDEESSAKKLAFSLAPFDGSSRYLSDAVKVYVSNWGHDSEEITQFIGKYSTYPDFRGLVALVEGDVIGSGFGHRSFMGN